MTTSSKHALVAAALLVGAAACAPAAGDINIAATSTDTTCTLSVATVPAGAVTFTVTNNGSAETELYVLDPNGKELAEVEHIGPGLTRDLTVDLTPGDYLAGCKPGMTGDAITAPFTVTE